MNGQRTSDGDFVDDVVCVAMTEAIPVEIPDKI
jgi:hypothetical protein